MPNAVPRLLPTTTPTVLVGLLSFAWIVSMSPWLDVFQIDPDEGLNLGKAALVAAGYSPYGDIWNDQGPVLTYLLAALQFVLGPLSDRFGRRPVMLWGLIVFVLASLASAWRHWRLLRARRARA